MRRLLLFALSVVLSASAGRGDDSTHDVQANWERFNTRHEQAFFKKAPFSLARHLQQREAMHRRLGNCDIYIADHNDFKNQLGKISAVLGGEMPNNLKGQVNRVIDVGNAIDATKFEKYMKAGNALLMAGMGGLAVLDITSSFAEANRLAQQADAVFKLLNEIKDTVNRIPETLAEQFVMSNFRSMLTDSQAMADIVLNRNGSAMIRSACREFRVDQISTAASSLINYGSICDRANNASANDQRACFVGMGESVGGALVRLIAAEATCGAYALTDTGAPLRIVEDKRATMNFLSSVAKRIAMITDDNADGTPGGTGGQGASDEFNGIIASFDKNITELTANISDSASFGDDVSEKFVTALNTYHFTNGDIIQNIKNVTSSEVYQALTEGNPTAGQAATVVAMAVGLKFNQSMEKLAGIKSNIEDKHAIRVDKIMEIDKKVWTNHNETMGKIDTMSTVFTGQHDVRMGRLSNIQSKVGTIQTRVSSGFQELRGKISAMGSTFSNKIAAIEQTVVSQGAETTSYLSNAISESTNRIGNRIDSIGTQVVEGHNRFMDAIGSTQQRTLREYDMTRNVLWSASDQLQQTIDTGMNSLSNTVAQSFDQVTDVVYRRMVDANVLLSNMLTGISGELTLIDNKLIVLDNQVFEMSNQLQVAQNFLEEINYSFDLIANGLKDAMAGIRAVLFQERLDGLYEQYEKMRQSYQSFLTSGQAIEETISSCKFTQISSLFLTMLDLVDIKDEEIPKHLEYFDFELRTYELFGISIIATLREVSFLDLVCAKIQFGPTPKDLEDLAKDQANLILQAAGTLTRQVSEAIPAFLMNYHATQRLEVAAQISWATNGFYEAERLRNELQVKIADFAQVSVIHAGADGQLDVRHLDLGFDYNNTVTARRRGILVSSDSKLAVVWSNTKQLAPSITVNDQQQTKLLRQGIYRGSIRSTSAAPRCFISTAPGYYPVCDNQCKCDHYEDFVSTDSAESGRAVTYFESDAYDSAFTVESVFEADVTYYIESIAVTIRNLGPSATASITGPTISKNQPNANRTEILWEGYSSVGSFQAFASGVMGKVLRLNELTLEVASDKVQGKKFSLFCDGELQKAIETSPSAELTYSCREIPRGYDSARVDGHNSSSPFTSMMTGQPTKRLENAVCAESGSTKSCKMVGSMTDLGAIGASGQLAVGSGVRDVTVYEEPAFKGSFTVCRQCSVKDLASISYRGSVLIGIPEVKEDLLDMDCYQPAARPNMLYCRDS